MTMTIKDIARMAGVSVSTVSKCINNYGDIGEDTRRKVLAIMEETGFKPNFSARTLISKRTHMIGVIFGHHVNYDFTHRYYTEVLNAFKQAIGVLGYDMLLFSNERFQPQGEDYLARCRHYKVDGCLIFAANDIAGAIKSLDRSEVPCVGIDLTLLGESSASVRQDNIAAGAAAADHLLGCGHRQIGYIGSRYAEPVYRYRESGMRQAMERRGVTANDAWIVYAEHQQEQDGYEAVRRLLEQGEPPTALFAGSDLLAFGAIRALKEAGIAVPQRVSVIGCDNIEACRFIDPPLTTLEPGKQYIGQQAAQLLHDLIERKGPAAKGSPAPVPELAASGTTGSGTGAASTQNRNVILVQSKVVVRASVAPPAAKL
ncbi:LacI family DNA-binding transcriptional regulator [Paenibacillus allorhizosphaerae]|nr:LacI family DNA-binding transcriptional regulator [Paenibacillus allorhizosphaerae]